MFKFNIVSDSVSDQMHDPRYDSQDHKHKGTALIPLYEA